MNFQDLYNKSVIKNIVSWNVSTEPTDDSYKAEEITTLDYLSSINKFINDNPDDIVSKHLKQNIFSEELEHKAIVIEQNLWKKYQDLKKSKSEPDDEYFDLFDSMVSIIKAKMKEKSWKENELTYFSDRQLGNPDEIISLVKEMAEISKNFIKNKPSNLVSKLPDFKMDTLINYMESFEDIGYKISDKNGSFMTSMDKNNSRIHISKNKKCIYDTASSITHEVGHALYQNRILNKNTLVGALGDMISLSLHESSSIFNEIALSGIDYDVTKNSNNLYRLGSDKIHYIIHIYIRMKVEELLFSNVIKSRDIPSVWNSLMLEYTGLEPSNSWEGFMQDVHWNSGSFGYFHSYAVGFFNAVIMYVKVKNKLSGDLVYDTLEIVMPTIEDWYGHYNENSYNILNDMHKNIDHSLQIYKYFIQKNFNYID